MKYRVNLDFGVDVAGQHYAHDAVIDSEKAVPPIPAEVAEEDKQRWADGLKKKTADDLAALAKDGSIVEDKPEPAKTEKAVGAKGGKE